MSGLGAEECTWARRVDSGAGRVDLEKNSGLMRKVESGKKSGLIQEEELTWGRRVDSRENRGHRRKVKSGSSCSCNFYKLCMQEQWT